MDLREEFVQPAFHHLATISGAARLLGARREDLALAGDHLGRHFGFGQIRGARKRDMHRDVLARIVAAVILHQHADAPAVHVLHELRRGIRLHLHLREAPDRDVLADF